MKLDVVDILLLIVLFILILSCLVVIFIRGSINEFRHNLDELEDLISCQTKDADDAHEIIDELTESRNKLQLQNERLSEELISMKNENEELRQIILDDVEEKAKEQTEEISKESSKDRLPKEIHTNMFRCEDFRRLNIESSEQYKLQQECITDLKTGIRCYTTSRDIYYCAALAGAYGATIGDAWEVTLADGNTFNIMMGDFKHPIDNLSPDDFGDKDQNYNGEDCINIIEFICDLKIAPKAVINAGTMSALEEFGGLYTDRGNIVKMKYIGRKWRP